MSCSTAKRQLGILVWSTAVAFAQQSAPDALLSRQASRLMQSAAFRDKAWGAYMAGQYGLHDLAGEISAQLAGLGVLASSGVVSDRAEYAAIQAALDAAIRLDVKPDGAVLLPFAKEWMDEVLILLAQDAQQNIDALFTLEPNDPVGARWVAVNNLLVEARNPGIAPRLLSRLSISHTFRIIDSYRFPPGKGGGTGGGVLCCGLAAPSRDLPPAGVYHLILAGGHGDVLIAPGTHPVYYRRTTGCHGYPFIPLDYQQYRLEYIAQLTSLPLQDVKQALTPVTTSLWTNLTAYQKQVAESMSAQRAAIISILDGLQAAGLLGPEDRATLRLEIVIDQDDQRQSGEALPNLLPMPIRTE